MPFDGITYAATLPWRVRRAIAGLERARAFLDGHGWTKGYAIIRHSGTDWRMPPYIVVRKSNIIRVCALGAIYATTGFFGPTRGNVILALAEAINWERIPKWNDAQSSKDAVIAGFDRAIDALRERHAHV